MWVEILELSLLHDSLKCEFVHFTFNSFSESSFPTPTIVSLPENHKKYHPSLSFVETGTILATDTII